MYLRKCFRKSVSEQVFPNRTPHLKTLRVLRCVVVTSNLFLHPCWHGVGTFSLYLEPCWHVAWRRFLNFLNAPKFAPELHQHGSKMGPRWPQAGPGQLKMALRWPKRATRPPKLDLDGPQDGPRRPKMAPRRPQDGPRWPKKVPRWPKTVPRWLQDGTKRALRAAKGRNVSLAPSRSFSLPRNPLNLGGKNVQKRGLERDRKVAKT